MSATDPLGTYLFRWPRADVLDDSDQDGLSWLTWFADRPLRVRGPPPMYRSHDEAVWAGVVDAILAFQEEQRDQAWAMYADPEDDYPAPASGAVLRMERGELQDRCRFAQRPVIAFLPLKPTPRFFTW